VLGRKATTARARAQLRVKGALAPSIERRGTDGALSGARCPVQKTGEHARWGSPISHLLAALLLEPT
jgi:hypothetical protein